MSGMKSMMKSVKKRLSTEATKAAWELEEDDKADFVINKHLPRFRLQRTVARSVLSPNLPALRDASPQARKKLLIRKLRLCSFIFKFTDQLDSPQDSKDKELKRAALLELVNYLTVFKPSFTETELVEIFDMLSANLFRPLPPTTFDLLGMYNPEEDEPQSEPTWPHLQVVYEFLLRLATSTETDSKLLDKFFSRTFVLNLLELFDSEDPRERDYLKTILHRIYGNFMGLRPFIRRAINNVFYRFIYETDRHNGISELLEILGSIINGFALPLKEQHKSFLVRVLLPLHKVTYVSVFHPQLSYCVTQFLEKDATLAPQIITSVLKFWPATSSKKELMFLNELEEILDRIQSHHLGPAQLPLFKQISRSINSPHFQVSERAIYVLNNEVILRFITNNREALVPILSKALYSNTFFHRMLLEQRAAADTAAGGDGKETAPPLKMSEMKGHQRLRPQAEKDEIGRPLQRWYELGHWNPTIVDLTTDILKLFTEMDAGLMERCSKLYNTNIRRNVDSVRARRRRWDDIEKATEAARRDFVEAVERDRKERADHSARDAKEEKERREKQWSQLRPEDLEPKRSESPAPTSSAAAHHHRHHTGHNGNDPDNV